MTFIQFSPSPAASPPSVKEEAPITIVKKVSPRKKIICLALKRFGLTLAVGCGVAILAGVSLYTLPVLFGAAAVSASKIALTVYSIAIGTFCLAVVLGILKARSLIKQRLANVASKNAVRNIKPAKQEIDTSPGAEEMRIGKRNEKQDRKAWYHTKAAIAYFKAYQLGHPKGKENFERVLKNRTLLGVCKAADKNKKYNIPPIKEINLGKDLLVTIQTAYDKKPDDELLNIMLATAEKFFKEGSKVRNPKEQNKIKITYSEWARYPALKGKDNIKACGLYAHGLFNINSDVAEHFKEQLDEMNKNMLEFSKFKLLAFQDKNVITKLYMRHGFRNKFKPKSSSVVPAFVTATLAAQGHKQSAISLIKELKQNENDKGKAKEARKKLRKLSQAEHLKGLTELTTDQLSGKEKIPTKSVKVTAPKKPSSKPSQKDEEELDFDPNEKGTLQASYSDTMVADTVV